MKIITEVKRKAMEKRRKAEEYGGGKPKGTNDNSYKNNCMSNAS